MIEPGTTPLAYIPSRPRVGEYLFNELWTGKVPKDVRAIWDAMSTKWKVKITGWGTDTKWIESAIRARCRDFLKSQHSIEHLRGIPAVAPPAWMYAQRVAAIGTFEAFIGAALAITALVQSYYYAGLLGGHPYGYEPEAKVWIDPTIMVDDNMQTAKQPELIASDGTVHFQLVPGAGLAGSKALRITFDHTDENHWRSAHIRYRFPGPLRQFALAGFNLRRVTEISPLTAEFFLSYSWRRRRLWSGFNYSYLDPQIPWTLVQAIPQTQYETNNYGEGIPLNFSPSWWEFDTAHLEYTKLNTFGQLHNVKGQAILANSYKAPFPGELNLILWHGWADKAVLDLDAVLLYEYGPYRAETERELHDRVKDLPITGKFIYEYP